MKRLIPISVLVIGLAVLATAITTYFQFRELATAENVKDLDEYPLVKWIASDFLKPQPGVVPAEPSVLAKSIQSRIFLMGMIGAVLGLIAVFYLLSQSSRKSGSET